MVRDKFISGFVFLLFSLCLSAACYADVTYVIDYGAGTGARGALFRVDPVTGARTLLSDFGDGPLLGSQPYGVAVEASGQILVIDADAGTAGRGGLFRVDPVTGARTLLSDFGAGPPLGSQPYGVAVEASGQILVIDYNAGTGNLGALFRVDPVTGLRTVLSDFGDLAKGTLGDTPRGVAVEASGQILVIDSNAGTGNLGALFRVDPVTGARTLLSDFGDGVVPEGVRPSGVAVETNGQILVTDYNAGTSYRGALFRVDPVTGARTLLSDFGDGVVPEGVNPYGVAVEASGQILVIDVDAGPPGYRGALFRVDPVTGARTLLSDFNTGAPLGDEPSGVAVFRQQPQAIPTMSEWGMIIFIVLAGLGAVYYLRRQKTAKI